MQFRNLRKFWMSAHAPSVCRNAEHTINTGKTLINFQHTYIQFIIDVDVSVSIFFYLCADIFSHAFQPVILSHMYSFQQKHNFQFLILAKHSIWFGHELIIRVQLFFFSSFLAFVRSSNRLTKWNFALFEQRNFRQRVEWSQNHDGIGTTGRFQPAKGGDED